MSNLNRHKDYYLRGWRSNVRAAKLMEGNDDDEPKSYAPERYSRGGGGGGGGGIVDEGAFYSLGNGNLNGDLAAAITSSRSNSRNSDYRGYYYYGEQPDDLATVSSDGSKKKYSSNSDAYGSSSRSNSLQRKLHRRLADEFRQQQEQSAINCNLNQEGDRYYVLPSRIHRRNQSPVVVPTPPPFHSSRNLGPHCFSSPEPPPPSRCHSQLSASSPDSLDGPMPSDNDRRNSKPNYYYRKLQSTESPARRRVVRHRERRNVAASKQQANTSHATNLSKSSPSLAYENGNGGGRHSRLSNRSGSGVSPSRGSRPSSRHSSRPPSRPQSRNRGGDSAGGFRRGVESSGGDSEGRAYVYHHQSCGSFVPEATSEFRSRSGSASLAPPSSANGQQQPAAQLSLLPNPDYSPIMTRRRYYEDRFLMDRDTSKLRYEDDRIKVSKKQISKKSMMGATAEARMSNGAPSQNLWSNANRYKGSLENELESQEADSSRSSRRIRDFLPKRNGEARNKRRRGRIFASLTRYPKSNYDDSGNSRMSSGRSSEDRDHEDSVGTVGRGSSKSMLYTYEADDGSYHRLGHRRQQPRGRGVAQRQHVDYEPLSLQGSVSSRISSYGGGLDRLEEEARRRKMHSEIRSKQSHFFNSLFPSRANRFGYPVFPERELGIPSRGGPVSFAGFVPSNASSTPTGRAGPESLISHARSEMISAANGVAAGTGQNQKSRSRSKIMNSLLKLF